MFEYFPVVAPPAFELSLQTKSTESSGCEHHYAQCVGAATECRGQESLLEKRHEETDSEVKTVHMYKFVRLEKNTHKKEVPIVQSEFPAEGLRQGDGECVCGGVMHACTVYVK